jgi:hypothetical protein
VLVETLVLESTESESCLLNNPLNKCGTLYQQSITTIVLCHANWCHQPPSATVVPQVVAIVKYTMPY